MATNDSNLLLIVEAARILEQNGTSPNHSGASAETLQPSMHPGHNGLNDYSQIGSMFKRSKRMKPQIAQAPTTVEITDLDAYEVDILREDNPFAKEDDDEEEEESDDSSNHSPCLKFPKLKFQNAKPVSQAKKVHNLKEKHRRKTLKQAQLALHRVLHPHSHQKPVLRIILCNAIHEIKRLNAVYKENENCLAALKKRQSSLAAQLENLKSMDVPQDDDNVDGCNDKKDNDISGPESVESFLDVEEAPEDLLDNNDQAVNINEEDLIKQTQEKDSLTTVNITETSPGITQSPAAFSSSYAQLYYYTQLLGCTTLLQSMQIHPYLNGGNVWLPPILWPHLHAMHSTVAGIPGSSTPMNSSMEPFSEASIQPGLVCSPVKCSVVKTIGSIDSDRAPHHESLSQNSAPFFCRQLC